MTLYQLQEEYMELLEMAENPDIDEQIITDTMEAIAGEIETKADGYAVVIKELEADARKLKDEEARLNARRRTIENNITTMKSNLQTAMTETGKTKFKTELFSFGIQKNPASVVIDGEVPEEYLIAQEPKVDRKKLLADLKFGKNLEGVAHLEQKESLRIS